MLSRREFLLGTAALAGLSACTLAPFDHLPPAQDGKKLEDILEQGIDHLRKQEYADARAHFYAYRHKLLVSTDRARSQYTIHYLYAISNVPEGTIFNGQLQEAGDKLTDLLYALRNSPEHVEWMQDDLKPFFALDEYPAYKRHFNRLRGKLQIFAFITDLLEQDYAGAQEALGKAFPNLSAYQQGALTGTLNTLVLRANARNDPVRAAQYSSLLGSAK